jgi:hypothetical protein
MNEWVWQALVWGWLIVMASTLRCAVSLGVAVRGRSLRYGDAQGAAQELVRGDVARWRRVAGVEAVYHGSLALLYVVPLLLGPPAPRWYVAVGRLVVGFAGAVAVGAMAVALWHTLVRHRHVYQAIDRGLGAPQ